MRSWMKYSMYIISLILVALILLPSLAVGKPPEDKDKDKDNGKPPKTKDEDKDNGKPPKTEDEDKNNGKPPKTKDEVKFVIITSSSGPNGNISPSGSVKVKIGDDQRFKVSANGGYRIKKVVADDNEVFSCETESNKHVRKWEYSFENVQESQDTYYIYAEFDRDVFTIKALARGAGTISPPGAVKVTYEGSQDFTIRATRGFCIDDVQISPSDDKNNLDMDVAKGASTYTFSFNGVTSDYTIIVTFARLKEPEPDPETDPEPLTIKSEAVGAGSIDPLGEVEVEYGSDQEFIIEPDSCHRISAVLVDEKPVEDVDIDEETGIGIYIFTDVKENHAIYATFEKITCTIKASAGLAGEGGSIEPSEDVLVECGESQTFIIEPDSCHRISAILVDEEPVEDVDIDEETGIGIYTFTDVKENHAIYATFEKITCTIKASAGLAGEGGSIEPSEDVLVECGESQTFIIEPDSCYRISAILVDDKPVEDVDIDAETGIGIYTFTDVKEDHTINATFEKITEPYTIEVTSGVGGSINPPEDVLVECGGNQEFTITPEECYDIAEVQVDGGKVDVDIDEETGARTYTFTNVTLNHSIHATFKKTTYTITAIVVGDGGRIDPSGDVLVECGGSQLFKIKPDKGYTRGIVLVDGKPVETKGNKYEFTDVIANHNIEVTFVNEPDEDDLEGDVNNDGKVNSSDAIFILLIVTGQIEPTEQERLAADVNGDGVIDIDDALLVLNIVAGLSAPEANVHRPDGEVTIRLEAANGIAGERVTIPLKAENATGLAGGRISIIYDSTVLRAVGVSSDPDLLIASNVAESGVAYIAFASARDLNDGTLLKIQFDVLADSVSSLNLKNVKLYRSDALPINGRLIDGHFASWAMRPENSVLLQNFPNPFNPETWIPFRLSEGSEVTIEIYDAMGHLVRRLPLGHKPAGFYTSQERAAYWDGCNEDGERVASGVYFYAIRAADFTDTKKMIIAQ